MISPLWASSNETPGTVRSSMAVLQKNRSYSEFRSASDRPWACGSPGRMQECRAAKNCSFAEERLGRLIHPPREAAKTPEDGDHQITRPGIENVEGPSVILSNLFVDRCPASAHSSVWYSAGNADVQPPK